MQAIHQQIERPAAIIFVAALLAGPAVACADADLLVAYTDGKRETVPTAEMPWAVAGAEIPKSGGLQVRGRPVRWVRDLQQPQLAAASPAVEFFGGDQLPAKVLAYERMSDEDGGLGRPGYLLVEPALAAVPADKQPSIRVSTAWIKRAVWEPRRGARYEPGSLFFRDGRQTSFRRARWSEGGVRLLQEQGTVLVTFDQIAEIHFPLADAWPSYLDQLALLAPDGAAWLMRVETAAGLKATASTVRSRFLPAASGGPQWLLQPAWCLDPLVISCASVSGWSCFAPAEVPLSALEPRRAVQRPLLGAGWPPYATDSNIAGGPLRSGGEQFGWGFGVHAYSRLEFDLNPLVKSLATTLGLDEASGSGGCVQATVSTTKPRAATLFTSSTLIGSAETLSTGRIDLKAQASGGARLQLTVDPLASERPARADPLDIRDTFDWLEPLLELDAAELRRLSPQRAADSIAELAGWNLHGTAGKDWRIVNEPRSASHPERGYRLLVDLAASPLVISRKLQAQAGGDQFEWLCRPLLAEGAVCNVELAVGGRRLDQLRLTHDELMSGPRRVSLAAFSGREIELTITLSTPKPPLAIDWQRLELTGSEPAKPAQ